MPVKPSLRPSRRQILKYSGLFSATAFAPALPTFAQAPAGPKELTSKGSATDNLYTRIGVRPLVNARGTYTIITGSISLPEVKQAMYEASQYYVQIEELMAAAGAEIAKHMGAPSAIVTCGCEAAIALATAACTVGADPELSQAYPNHKERPKVLIPKYSRNPYDFGTRMAGAEIVMPETEEQLRTQLDGTVAMIYVMSGPRAFQEPLSIKTLCTVAKEKGVPVFVDAAAEEPLVPNIHLAAGATFVGYSGGKCMRGPQAAGVLLGPKDLCAAAFFNAAPHHNWGRALKVGKEEIMGMLAAVRKWYERDHEAEQKQWLAWDQHIADALKGIPSLTTKINMPTEDLSNRAPTLDIEWDAAQVGITGTELVAALDKGTPRILVVGGKGHRPDAMASSIGIMPYMMEPDDHRIVADALSKHLRHPDPVAKASVPQGPPAQLTGTWNVVVTYVRGTGHQQMTLQQQGDNVTGELKGELYSAPISGKVVGDNATLGSTLRPNDYEVNFRFSGPVANGTYSGELNLGEYGTATFTATKQG